MNNSQAHNALRYINQTMDEKINTFEKLCNHSYINENDYEETFCSLLGAYYKNVKSKNFDDVFNATITEKNITDANIKELQGKKVKAKSVADLKEKISNCLEGKQTFYNSFINELSAQISSVLNNEEAVKNTPFELLTDLNQIRFEAGLSRVLESDDEILKNCYIDNKNIIPEFNAEKIATSYEELKTLIFEKYNLYVQEYDGETTKIEKGVVCVPKSLANETYGVVLQTLNAALAVCENYVCKDRTLESYLKLSDYNASAEKALEAYNELSDKQAVETDFKMITNLIATENFVKLVYDKEEYSQVLKLFNYSLCKKLSFVASKLNKQGIIYALSTAIIEDVTKVFNNFGLSVNDVKALNDKLGLRTTNQDEITSLESLVLAEQEYLLNFQNVDLANKFSVNYDELKEKDLYQYYYSSYTAQMKKLLETDDFSKSDIEEVRSDIASVKAKLEKSNSLVTNHNHITKEELIACVDCFGLVNASRETVENIETELNLSANKETANIAVENLDEEIVVNNEDKLNIASNNIAIDANTLANSTNYVVDSNVSQKNDVTYVVDDQKETHSDNTDENNATIDKETDVTEEVVNEVNKSSSNSNNILQENNVVEKIDEDPIAQEEKLNIADNDVRYEESNNLKAELFQKQAQIDNQNSVINKQNTELTRKAEELTKKNSLLSQKDDELNQKESLLNQATAEITHKDTLLNQKDAELSQKEKDMFELQRQIDQLKAQLAQKQTNSQPAEPTPVKRNFNTIMQEKISNTLITSTKSVVVSMLSPNTEKLSDKLLLVNKKYDSVKKLVILMYKLYNMEKSTDENILTLIELTDKQTIKNLMLLKSSLEKIFVPYLSRKLSNSVIDYDTLKMNNEDLVKKIICSSSNKYSKMFVKKYNNEYNRLIETYGDEDSFECQLEMMELKEKYYGNNSKDGLFKQLNDVLPELMLKDVIITELNKIADCEKSGEKYSFNEAKAQQIIDEIFMDNKDEETESLVF